jgi:hypothetical protein
VLAAAVHTRTTATHATTPRRLTEERQELIEAVHHRCRHTPHDHLDSVEPREDTIAAIGLGLDTSGPPPNTHVLTTPARADAPALGRLSDRHPAPTDRGTTRRAVPPPGQRVRLGAAASPQFRQHPITLLITSPVRPSTVDSAQRHQVAASTWWLITGWELGPRQQPVLLREVSVRAAGTDILPAAIPVTPGPFV